MEGVYAPDLKVALRNSPEVSLVDLCINFFLADDSRATLLIDVENRRPLPCLVFSPMLAQRVFRQCKVSSAIDSYLPLFSVPEQVPLNGVIDIPHSSVSCLFPLSSQEVYFLNCAYCSNISIDHVQECFNNSTKSLTHLNLEALTSELKTKIEIWLGKCTNLEHLTLGCTNLSYSSIARDTLPYLQNLRHLDLSEIQITDDMDVLLQLSNSLTSLVLHNVDPHQGILVERRFNNIFKLKKLQNLDISYSKSDGISISYGIDNLLLNLAIDLPDLVSLDLSGTVVADEQVNRSLLQLYLKRRPQTVDSVIPALQVLQAPLEFLGLLNCNAALLQKIPAKAVTGTSNERQLLENFKRYRTRKPFILETFHSLYQLLRDKVITRPVDFLHHIIDCMKLYITAIDIQVSGSASLYHLSSDDNYKTKLNVLHKNAIIEQCVMSMRTHKLHDGMQRNGCLVMFNFDVPDSLEFVYDEIIEQLLHTIEKMTTNVSRIAIHLLNAMMGHADRKHKLRAERLQVIKVLVAAINSRFERQEHDELIDHAWSSLWNLTDETEINCQMFINLDGINLFLKCYHAFRFHEDLSRNMLGCLGNVAEVKSLRKHMLNEDCLNVFIQLLKPYSQGWVMNNFGAGKTSNSLHERKLVS